MTKKIKNSLLLIVAASLMVENIKYLNYFLPILFLFFVYKRHFSHKKIIQRMINKDAQKFKNFIQVNSSNYSELFKIYEKIYNISLRHPHLKEIYNDIMTKFWEGMPINPSNQEFTRQISILHQNWPKLENKNELEDVLKAANQSLNY